MPVRSVSSLLQLPKRKRMEIAESLWLLVADEEKVPVPESHKKILDAQLADYHAGRVELSLAAREARKTEGVIELLDFGSSATTVSYQASLE